MVVYLFFIETKRPSLEEVALFIDGKDAKVASVSPVAEKVKEGKVAVVEGDTAHIERAGKKHVSGLTQVNV